MKLFDCRYDYETPAERGTGRIVLIAEDEDAAIAKAKMIGGADSNFTNCSAVEAFGGFIRMGEKVLADAIEVKREEAEKAEAQRLPRFHFQVAAMATVIARDRFAAYKQLSWMVKQDTPPDGLKRKVVSKEPLEETQSRFDRNAQYTETRIFQGGKAGG